MTQASTSDLDRLVNALAQLLSDGWEPWPGGYPNELEQALVDAVFSIRAAYGRESDITTGREATGVYKVVNRWRDHRGERADDLRVIAQMDVTGFENLLVNRSIVSGRSKASAVHEAATKLIQVGITSATEFMRNIDDARAAYTSVHGLGTVTFNYVYMLLGGLDVKADVWITRFVEDALERRVSRDQARALFHSLADRLGEDPVHGLPTDLTDLDHAIWYAMRQTKLRTKESCSQR